MPTPLPEDQLALIGEDVEAPEDSRELSSLQEDFSQKIHDTIETKGTAEKEINKMFDSFGAEAVRLGISPKRFKALINIFIHESRERLGNLTQNEAKNQNRGISVEQGAALLDLAEALGHDAQWIDEFFTFEGGKIIAHGNIDLSGRATLPQLPDHLHVEGNISLSKCPNLKKLPEGLSATRNISVSDCPQLTTLPDGIRAYSIWCDNCTGLTSLPKNIITEHGLFIDNCTGLTELPSGLNRVNDIRMNGCTNIKTLPAMHINGILEAGDCTGLTSVSDQLVARNLILDGCTGIQSIPNTIRVSSLSLHGCTGLTSLPEGLEVRLLSIKDCANLSKFPNSVQIKMLMIPAKGLHKQIYKDVKGLRNHGNIHEIQYTSI